MYVWAKHALSACARHLEAPELTLSEQPLSHSSCVDCSTTGLSYTCLPTTTRQSCCHTRTMQNKEEQQGQSVHAHEPTQQHFIWRICINCSKQYIRLDLTGSDDALPADQDADLLLHLYEQYLGGPEQKQVCESHVF